jgi:Ca-activated chloride channel family protein
LVRAALDGRNRLRSHVPALCVLGALALCVLAIARPSGMIETPARERTIILAIDVSLSMGADDVKPSRLAAAQAAARSFVAGQPADVRIGIVAFAGHAYLVQPPTVDRKKALDAIGHLYLQPATAIGSGIVGALMTLFPDDRFAENFDIFGAAVQPEVDDRLRYDRDRGAQSKTAGPGTHPSAAIVLLTDGADTGGIPTDLAAQFAAQRGVRVYTVGFGLAVPAEKLHDAAAVQSGFDEAALMRIARVTHGEYFPASTAQQLDSIYRQLPGHIVMRTMGTELTAVLAAAAALLALAASALSLAWRGPLPA